MIPSGCAVDPVCHLDKQTLESITPSFVLCICNAMNSFPRERVGGREGRREGEGERERERRGREKEREREREREGGRERERDHSIIQGSKLAVATSPMATNLL